MLDETAGRATIATIPRRPALDVRFPVTVAAALIAVGIAQFADLLTFLRMVALVGLHAELNPIVSHTAAEYGVNALVAAKIGVVLLVVAACAAAVRFHPRVAAGVMTFGTVAGLVGAASNVWAVL